MKSIKSAILAMVLAVTWNVGAATLTFEYEVADGVLSGTLVGNLLEDNDTFLVTQALELSINGFSLDVSGFYVGQFSTLNDDLPGGVPIDPTINNIATVSLSGQIIDLAVCDRELCVFGVVLSNGIANFADNFYADVSPDLNALADFGFVEANWSASIQPVPLPAAGWLLLTALVGLQRFSRKQA